MAFILPSDLTETCKGLFYCWGLWMSNVTDGLFWVFALLGFCAICFMATIRYQTPRAFGFASVIGLLGAIWLAILKYIAWWSASAFIITGLVGFVVLIMHGK